MIQTAPLAFAGSLIHIFYSSSRRRLNQSAWPRIIGLISPILSVPIISEFFIKTLYTTPKNYHIVSALICSLILPTGSYASYLTVYLRSLGKKTNTANYEICNTIADKTIDLFAFISLISSIAMATLHKDAPKSLKYFLCATSMLYGRQDITQLFKKPEISVTKKPYPMPDFLTNLNQSVLKNSHFCHTNIDNSTIQKMVDTLSAKTQTNNVLLIGKAGSGKTHLLQELAYLLHQIKTDQNVEIKNHTKLKDYTIYTLNIPVMEKGCSYVGDFNKKISQLTQFLTEHPHSIIFIDEIHSVVNLRTNGRNSSTTLSQELNPLIEDPNIHFIGATTPAAFIEHMQKDHTFVSRFKQIGKLPPLKEKEIDEIIIQHCQNNYPSIQKAMDCDQDSKENFLNALKTWFDKRKELPIRSSILDQNTSQPFRDSNRELIRLLADVDVYLENNLQATLENALKHVQDTISQEEQLLDKVFEEDGLPNFLTNLNQSVLKNPHFCHTNKDNSIIQQIVNILSTKTQTNNVLLIGEAGSGKTHLIQELAYFINQIKTHQSVEIKNYTKLKDYTIYTLNITTMNQNSGRWTGGFDAKISQLTQFLHQHPNSIIFLDEIHSIINVGTHAADYSSTFSNRIKTLIEDPNIHFIGATTPAEFMEHMQKDHAFVSRFKKIGKPPLREEEIDEIIIQCCQNKYPSIQKAMEHDQDSKENFLNNLKIWFNKKQKHTNSINNNIITVNQKQSTPHSFRQSNPMRELIQHLAEVDLYLKSNPKTGLQEALKDVQDTMFQEEQTLAEVFRDYI